MDVANAWFPLPPTHSEVCWPIRSLYFFISKCRCAWRNTVGHAVEVLGSMLFRIVLLYYTLCVCTLTRFFFFNSAGKVHQGDPFTYVPFCFPFSAIEIISRIALKRVFKGIVQRKLWQVENGCPDKTSGDKTSVGTKHPETKHPETKQPET